MKKSELRQIVKEEIQSILTESKQIGSVTVYPNARVVGSSHHYTFTEQEHNKVYKWLKKHSKTVPELGTIVQQLDHREKYTDTVLVAFHGKAFTVYGASGNLRVGSGGNATSAPKLLSPELFKDFAKELK